MNSYDALIDRNGSFAHDAPSRRRRSTHPREPLLPVDPDGDIHRPTTPSPPPDTSETLAPPASADRSTECAPPVGSVPLAPSLKAVLATKARNIAHRVWPSRASLRALCSRTFDRALDAIADNLEGSVPFGLERSDDME